MLDIDMLIKFAPASVATAFASIVFPVPGGPNNSIPLQGWNDDDLDTRRQGIQNENTNVENGKPSLIVLSRITLAFEEVTSLVPSMYLSHYPKLQCRQKLLQFH